MKLRLKIPNMGAPVLIERTSAEIVDTLSPKVWDREVRRAKSSLAKKAAVAERRAEERVNRALAIKKSTISKIDRRDPNSAWLVPSQTTVGVSYIVTDVSCTCEGFKYRQWCKHLDKIKMGNK